MKNCIGGIILPEKEGYEVIKFVEKKSICYTSTDYAEGVTLEHWIRYHKKIKKEKLYNWFQDLLVQLEMFHKQKGGPNYNYLNPYHIIVTRQNRLLLMDTEAFDKHMEYPLDKYFIPVTVEQNSDIYCFGKIIQFIMAHIQCEPCLTKKEEHRLLKIVKKCLETRPNYHYKNIQTIQNDFIRKNGSWFQFQQIPFKKIQFNKKILGVIATVIIFAVGYQLLGNNENAEESTPGIQMETQMVEETDENIYFDAGLMHFLQFDNYEKSIGCFKRAEENNIKAKYYVELAEYLSKGKKEMIPEISLQRLKREVTRQQEQDVKEIIILMKAYAFVDKEEAYRSIVELGNLEKLKNEWENLPDYLQREICQYLALAYEKLEMWDEAAEVYQRLCEMEKIQNEKEQLYLKIIEIYKRQNKIDEIQSFTKKEIEDAELFVDLLMKQGMQKEGENLWEENGN